MNTERTVFSQILDFVPRHQFRACVNRYNGNYRTKSFSCFDQYLTMAFAQLANISRFCASPNQKRQATLRQRGLRNHIKKYRLCSGRNRNRSMSVFVPMGSASQAQKCCKATHANGPSREHPFIHPHFQ